MKLKIFYSWQSQTDEKLNRYFISETIEAAVQIIKQKDEYQDVEFEIVEGTRSLPGSPVVGSKIVEELIPDCDIFIADLSVVNRLGCTAKFIVTKLLNEQYRPQQNNNVIHEYGAARTKLGEERIIGILNSVYGSPNENPENITFDIRHLKFPIGYSLKNIKHKANVQESLINSLVEPLSRTIAFAITHQKNKYRPLSIYDDWKIQFQSEQEYVNSEKSDEISA